MMYIIWTMTQDEDILFVGNVEWDTQYVVWTSDEAEAGLFYAEEVEVLEEWFDFLHAEEVDEYEYGSSTGEEVL